MSADTAAAWLRAQIRLLHAVHDPHLLGMHAHDDQILVDRVRCPPCAAERELLLAARAVQGISAARRGEPADVDEEPA